MEVLTTVRLDICAPSARTGRQRMSCTLTITALIVLSQKCAGKAPYKYNFKQNAENHSDVAIWDFQIVLIQFRSCRDEADGKLVHQKDDKIRDDQVGRISIRLLYLVE